MNINELEINDLFFATKKFGITFTGGTKQYQGVIRANSRFLIYNYRKIDENIDWSDFGLKRDEGGLRFNPTKNFWKVCNEYHPEVLI